MSRSWPCRYTQHIAFGPVTGTFHLAEELMRWFGVDPDKHPEAFMEIAEAIGEEMLDTGLAILRERGIPAPAVDLAAMSAVA